MLKPMRPQFILVLTIRTQILFGHLIETVAYDRFNKPDVIVGFVKSHVIGMDPIGYSSTIPPGIAWRDKLAFVALVNPES